MTSQSKAESILTPEQRAEAEKNLRVFKAGPELVSTGRDLLAALRRYGFPMSDEAWGNVGDDSRSGRQASLEARALHRAAIDFGAAMAKATGVATQ